MSYLSKMNKASLNAKVRITRKAQREIIDLYSNSITDLSKKLEKSGGLKKEYIEGRMRGLNDELESIVLETSEESAKAAVQLHKGTIEEIASRSGKKLQFDRLFANIPTEVIAVMKDGGIYKDGQGLSSRIWNYTGRNAKYIEDIIYSGLAEGTSAKDLAKFLEDYVNPQSRKIWDNERVKELLGDSFISASQQVEYNALRLARTSIAHSFTVGNKLSAGRNPFVQKFKWHSVFAHGRTCEICMAMDGNIYTIEDLPFDHPNGLCWEEPLYEKNLDEYAKEIGNWVDGGENEALDDWYENIYNVPAPKNGKLKGEAPAEFKPGNYQIATEDYMENYAAQFYEDILTTADKEILNRYVGTNGSFHVNEYLYSGGYAKGTDSDLTELVDKLSNVIKKDTLPQDLKLARMVDDNFLSSVLKDLGENNADNIVKEALTQKEAREQLESMLSGVEYTNKSFISTSYSIDKNIFGTTRPIRMEMYADKGTKALITDNYMEGEVLLDKGTKLEFIGFDSEQIMIDNISRKMMDRLVVKVRVLK